MTQAACVMLSQLLFLAGADARDNKVRVCCCSELLNKPSQPHKPNKLNAPLELKFGSTLCPDSGGAAVVSALDHQVVSLDRTFALLCLYSSRCENVYRQNIADGNQPHDG